MALTWNKATGVPPEALRPAILEVHQAVQLLAAVGGALVEPRADDSHRTLEWHSGLGALVGEPFTDPPHHRVALRPELHCLMVLGKDDAPLTTLALHGRTVNEALGWLEEALAEHAERPGLSLSLPDFEIPENPVGKGGAFGRNGRGERQAVAALYARAWAVLTEWVGGRDDASPVRCWPHHFDVATLLTVREGADGEADRTVGVGFAPMGGGHDHWYWYVNVWPVPEEPDLPELSAGTCWQTEGWLGAVLPAADVVRHPGEERKRVGAFLAEAVPAARALLAD